MAKDRDIGPITGQQCMSGCDCDKSLVNPFRGSDGEFGTNLAINGFPSVREIPGIANVRICRCLCMNESMRDFDLE